LQSIEPVNDNAPPAAANAIEVDDRVVVDAILVDIYVPTTDPVSVDIDPVELDSVVTDVVED
jgi:hypothetical protein